MAEDSTELGIVGNPVGDDRVVADALLNFRSLMAKVYVDPSVENERALATVAIDPLLASVTEVAQKLRSNNQTVVPSPTEQAWFRVMSDGTVIRNDTATVEVCELDSRVLVQQGEGGDEVIDDSVVMSGWEFGLIRFEGRWILTTFAASEELKARCETG